MNRYRGRPGFKKYGIMFCERISWITRSTKWVRLVKCTWSCFLFLQSQFAIINSLRVFADCPHLREPTRRIGAVTFWRGIGVWLFERATNVDRERGVVFSTNMEEGTSRTMIDEDQVIVDAVGIEFKLILTLSRWRSPSNILLQRERLRSVS